MDAGKGKGMGMGAGAGMGMGASAGVCVGVDVSVELRMIAWISSMRLPAHGIAQELLAVILGQLQNARSQRLA